MYSLPSLALLKIIISCLEEAHLRVGEKEKVYRLE